MMLQESDIIWLNKLKRDRPDFYERKLRILGITDEDVPYREMVHPSKAVSKAEDDKRLFHMGGKPYYGVTPMGYMPAPAKDSVSIEKKAVKADELYTGDYYLVDGDNHPYEALEGLNDLSKNDMVMIYVTQEGLKDNLNAEYGNKIHVIMVKSGDQAVDNQIRAILGNAVHHHSSPSKRQEHPLLHPARHRNDSHDSLPRQGERPQTRCRAGADPHQPRRSG